MDKKKLTIKEVAAAMGKGEQWVRVALQRELLPFGVALKIKSMWSYYINPKQFYDYIGTEKEAQ